MSQTERLYRLKNWFDSGRCLPRGWLLHEFAILPATLKRDLAHLRDRVNVPTVFDRERGGWRLELPCADPRELVMDILRHVPEVQALGPEELREAVAAQLRAGLSATQKPSAADCCW